MDLLRDVAIGAVILVGVGVMLLMAVNYRPSGSRMQVAIPPKEKRREGNEDD